VTEREQQLKPKPVQSPVPKLCGADVEVVLTGQGKVGSENGAPPVDYQLSQRADFFHSISGSQTTFLRPMVNSRDEPLCGHPCEGDRLGAETGVDYREGLARMHVIFYDTGLCQAACLMKVGMMQVTLAMLEAGRFDPGLILEDPLDAVLRFSHDRTLGVRAATLGGRRLTAVEWLLRWLDEAERYHDRGGFDGVVPRVGEILALVADTLEALRAGELDTLAGRLDWVLKLRALEQAMALCPELGWDSPEIKHLDHVYSALDPQSGLYWGYERAGVVERVVEEAEIDRFLRQPPQETRAWTRAMLLRLAEDAAMHQVDWDAITFKQTTPRQETVYRTVTLADPLRMGRAETGHLFGPGHTLAEVLDGLAASEWGGHEGDLTPPPVTIEADRTDGPCVTAGETTAAGGSGVVAVHDCGSFWQGDLKLKGVRNDRLV
jgi:proteasome accessory factor A